MNLKSLLTTGVIALVVIVGYEKVRSGNGPSLNVRA